MFRNMIVAFVVFFSTARSKTLRLHLTMAHCIRNPKKHIRIVPLDINSFIHDFSIAKYLMCLLHQDREIGCFSDPV